MRLSESFSRIALRRCGSTEAGALRWCDEQREKGCKRREGSKSPGAKEKSEKAQSQK